MGATTGWTKVYDEEDYVPGKGLFTKVYTFTGSASYATSGETFDAAVDIGLDAADTIVDLKFKDESMTYDCVHDGDNNKILFFDANTITQVTNTTDVTAATITAAATVLKGAI